MTCGRPGHPVWRHDCAVVERNIANFGPYGTCIICGQPDDECEHQPDW